MNSYIGKALLFVLSISLTLGFQACDNKETTTNDDRRLVAGKVIKGPVQNAAIKVYTLNSNRFRDAIIGEGGTAYDGSFSLQVDNNKGGPLVLIVANGGDYTDEATGQRVAIPSWWELSVLVPWPNDYSKVILTPLTQMASEQAFSRIIRGENPLSAQENGRRSVADYFGLRNVDITRVEPADLTSRNTVMRRGNPETEYGLVLAALSQMTKGEGLPPLLTLSLIQNIVDDISDGRVDNVGRNGSVLPNNLTATPSYLIASLPGASNDFLRGPRNASGIPGADFPTYTQAQGSAVPNRPTQGGSGGGSSGGSSGGGQICDPCYAAGADVCSFSTPNCAAGPDVDGFVQCSDGTSDVNVPYSCNGSSLPAPTGVTATPGVCSVTVSWNEVAGAASYIVYVNVGLGPVPFPSAGPSEIIDGLQGGGLSYTFWVTAVDSSDAESAESSHVTATPTGSCSGSM